MLSNEKKIFITGAGGFIGASLTRKLLKKGYEVHVLIHTKKIPWRLNEILNQITVHNVDLTDFISLRHILLKTFPDYIIHLAAYGSYSFQNEIDQIVSVNVLGTKNLLEASRDIPYKCFINTGSSSEYGFKDKPMKETDFCNPVSYYGATKLTATQICKIFANINKKPIVTLRLFSVYGPYEDPTRFIPTITKSLLVKDTIKLTPGNQRRDFIYIDDVVNAYLKSLYLGLKMQGEIFNIGTGKEYSNDEVVRKLFNVTKNSTRVKKNAFPKKLWDTNHWRANIYKTKKKLNWKPKYDLNAGLKKNYEWFERNLNFYN